MAARSDVIRMVVKQGMLLASIGLFAGIVASVALARLVSGLLFDVSATEPFVLIGVSLVLSAVAFAAAYPRRPSYGHRMRAAVNGFSSPVFLRKCPYISSSTNSTHLNSINCAF